MLNKTRKYDNTMGTVLCLWVC